MATPAPAWNLVTVQSTWHNQDGSKKAGAYTVTIPERIVSVTDDVIIPAGQFTSGELNVSTGPSLSVQVPAMDDPDILPRGKDLVIEVTFTDGSPSETFKVSPTLAGGTLNLRTVPLPSNGSAPSNLAYIGVPGGVAKLDADGDVVDADGVKVISSSTPPANATSTVTGLVRLTGDLGGTATSPTVPRLDALEAELGNKQTAGAAFTLAQLPGGSSIVIDYYKNVYGAANAWPASRPTNRTDLDVTWRGPTDPGSIMLAGDILDLTGP